MSEDERKGLAQLIESYGNARERFGIFTELKDAAEAKEARLDFKALFGDIIKIIGELQIAAQTFTNNNRLAALEVTHNAITSRLRDLADRQDYLDAERLSLIERLSSEEAATPHHTEVARDTLTLTNDLRARCEAVEADNHRLAARISVLEAWSDDHTKTHKEAQSKLEARLSKLESLEPLILGRAGDVVSLHARIDKLEAMWDDQLRTATGNPNLAYDWNKSDREVDALIAARLQERAKEMQQKLDASRNSIIYGNEAKKVPDPDTYTSPFDHL